MIPCDVCGEPFDPTGQWQPPEGCWTIDIPEGCPAGIGWQYVDGEWVLPPPIVTELEEFIESI